MRDIPTAVPAGRQGFTLIELMVAIVVLAILSTAGVNIFYRSLRGSSQVELRRALDDRSRLIMSALGRYIREGRIVSLSGVDKNSCVASGQATGTSLVIRALDDLDSTISLTGGQISSSSAEGTVVMNPGTEYTISQADTTPLFTWYCASGVADRVLVNFRGSSVSNEGDVTVTKDYSLDLILRNSGQ